MADKSLKALLKRQTMAVQAFERTFASLSNVLETTNTSAQIATAEKTLCDLETKYENLEELSQDVMLNDGHENKFDELLYE